MIDLATTVGAWPAGPDTSLGSGLARTGATPPVAPPELVHRFESLMQRAQATGSTAASNWHVPSDVVARVDHHVQERIQAFDQLTSADTSHMSLPELEVFQIRSIVQLGTLSMTQSACFQVLGSAKSSVSDLMKNQ